MLPPYHQPHPKQAPRLSVRAVAWLGAAAWITACSSTPPAPAPAPKPPAAETITSAIVAEAPKLKNNTVAVIEFSELRGDAYVPSPRGRLLAERITTRLVNSGQVEVVERGQLDKVMGELKFDTSGLVNDASAKSVGKLLGVEAIVTGTLTDVGGETEIHSRMVRVEDGMILAAVTTRDVIPVIGRLAELQPNADLAPRFSRGDGSGDLAMSEPTGAYLQYDRLLREGRLQPLEREIRLALDRDWGDFVAHLYQALLLKEAHRAPAAKEHLRLAYEGALQSSQPERGIRIIAVTLLRNHRPGMARGVVMRALHDRPELRHAPDFQPLLQRLEIR